MSGPDVRQGRDPAEVTEWVVGWISARTESEASPQTPIYGELNSLHIAELLAAAEARWDVDLSDGQSFAALADIASLAGHLCGTLRRSRRAWFSAGTTAEVGRPVLPSGALFTASASGEPLVGLPRSDAGFEGPLGSVLAVGEEARALEDFVRLLRSRLGFLAPTPVWFPIMTNSGVAAEHPQNVGSALRSGRLPHAACLQFLGGVADLADGLYTGIGYAFRDEPARRWRPQGRLEAYRVYEIVGCGGPDRVAGLADAVVETVGEILAEILDGGWDMATDGFTDGMNRKLEWTVAQPAGPMALASFNDHGTSFTHDVRRTSFCVGVGVDRLSTLGIWR